MTASEKSVQKLSPTMMILLVTGLILLIVMAVCSGYNQQVRQSAKEYQEKNHPSFERAMVQLQELANKGCQVPFEECLAPQVAKWRVLDAMDREKIAFDTPRGVTPDKLDEIVAQAYVRIASQKLAYLKANGGVKYPSDIALLEDVCLQVYIYKRPLPGGNPTDEELKQLLPPGVTKVFGCNWGENK